MRAERGRENPTRGREREREREREKWGSPEAGLELTRHGARTLEL